MYQHCRIRFRGRGTAERGWCALFLTTDAATAHKVLFHKKNLQNYLWVRFNFRL